MKPANPVDRKKQLIVQGAVYRAEIVLAKQMTEASLQPDSLAKSALQQVALIAFAMFKNRGGAGLPGLNVQTLLPLVMPLMITGVSALAKRKSLLKPIVRGVLLAGVAAGIAAFISKKKTAVCSTSDSID